MTRQEKKEYVVKDTKRTGSLEEIQNDMKFAVLQEYVKIRKSKGITQEELSKRTGIARPNIARIENGSYNPTIEMLVRLAHGLDMHLDIKWVPNEK